MESMELRTRVGPDGILQVFMPDDMAGREIRVVVVFEALRPDQKSQSHAKTKWPENYFDKVAGSIPDFPEIEHEGDFEQRGQFD